MSEARHILETYLARIGLSQPADAVQQVQITMLRQWTEHLDDVLHAELIPFEQRSRIIRAMIYGGAPHQAEEEIRTRVAFEMRDFIEHHAGPRQT
jgi:hypothetical protein